MVTRGVILLLLLAGCSSESAAPADLAAGPLACMFSWSGDVTGTRPCDARFCRQPTADGIVLMGDIPPGPLAVFGLDGPFTPGRSYTAADLQTFNAGVHQLSSPTTYSAGSSIPGSTVTLTITDVDENPGGQCGPNGNGTAHGSAQMGLIEDINDDAGARVPGHVTLDVVF